MSKIISFVIGIFQHHKLKILALISSIFFFLFVLFPYNDLTDLISGKISELTQNQLFVQFDGMRLGLFPSPEFSLENVAVDTRSIPTIKANEITLSPSFSSLFSKTPAGELSAKGFMKGNVEIKIHPGPKSEAGTARNQIEIQAKKLSLQEIREVAQLPLQLKGNVDLSTTALADLTFTEQPEMELNLKIDRFELPPGNVQTPMGPMQVPDFKLASVELKGKLQNGFFKIEEGKIGQAGDDLYGTIKGGIALQLQNRGGIVPVIGSYNLDIDLTTKESFQSKAALILTVIDQYKSQTSGGTRYAFRLSASNPFMPPNMSALR